MRILVLERLQPLDYDIVNNIYQPSTQGNATNTGIKKLLAKSGHDPKLEKLSASFYFGTQIPH